MSYHAHNIYLFKYSTKYLHNSTSTSYFLINLLYRSLFIYSSVSCYVDDILKDRLLKKLTSYCNFFLCNNYLDFKSKWTDQQITIKKNMSVRYGGILLPFHALVLNIEFSTATEVLTWTYLEQIIHTHLNN